MFMFNIEHARGTVKHIPVWMIRTLTKHDGLVSRLARDTCCATRTQIGHKLGVSEGKCLPFCLCGPQCDPAVSVSQMSLICYREVNPNEFHSLSLAYQRTMYLHTHVALV